MVQKKGGFKGFGVKGFRGSAGSTMVSGAGKGSAGSQAKPGGATHPGVVNPFERKPSSKKYAVLGRVRGEKTGQEPGAGALGRRGASQGDDWVRGAAGGAVKLFHRPTLRRERGHSRGGQDPDAFPGAWRAACLALHRVRDSAPCLTWSSSLGRAADRPEAGEHCPSSVAACPPLGRHLLGQTRLVGEPS